MNESLDEGEVRTGLGYRIETYHQILKILSDKCRKLYPVQHSMQPAVEITGRLPNVSPPFLNRCLSEVVDRQLLRYSDSDTGPYRYRITH